MSFLIRSRLFWCVVYSQTFHLIQRGNAETCNNAGETVCCAGFERLGDGCVECARGTHSIPGERCIECPPDYYGKWCATKCQCSPTERCDSIDGCTLDNKTIGFVKPSDEGPLPPIDATTSNILPIGNILLIAAVSMLTVLVLMCGLWQYQKHKQNRQESASPNHNDRTGHNDVVYGYNEINENAVTELPNRQRTTECPPQLPERNEGFKDSDKSQNKTNSIDDLKTLETMNANRSFQNEQQHEKQHDEYLNPYQPMVTEHLEIHEYKSTSKMKNDNVPVIKEDANIDQSELKKGMVGEQKNEYLNPYQPMIQDEVGTHEYESNQSKKNN